MNAKDWLTPTGGVVVLGFAVLAIGGFVWWKYRQGNGAYQLGVDIASGAADAVVGVASVPLNAVSRAIGIGQTSELTDDVQTVRTMIANQGLLYASKWSTAGAFIKAAWEGPLEDYGREGKVRAIESNNPNLIYPGSY